MREQPGQRVRSKGGGAGETTCCAHERRKADRMNAHQPPPKLEACCKNPHSWGPWLISETGFSRPPSPPRGGGGWWVRVLLLRGSSDDRRYCGGVGPPSRDTQTHSHLQKVGGWRKRKHTRDDRRHSVACELPFRGQRRSVGSSGMTFGGFWLGTSI